MSNSMVVFIASEIPFLGKFGPKNENCQFRLEFGTYSNANIKDSMVMLTLSVFGPKNSLLWQICFKKTKMFVEAKIWNLD